MPIIVMQVLFFVCIAALIFIFFRRRKPVNDGLSSESSPHTHLFFIVLPITAGIIYLIAVVADSVALSIVGGQLDIGTLSLLIFTLGYLLTRPLVMFLLFIISSYLLLKLFGSVKLAHSFLKLIGIIAAIFFGIQIFSFTVIKVTNSTYGENYEYSILQGLW